MDLSLRRSTTSASYRRDDARHELRQPVGAGDHIIDSLDSSASFERPVTAAGASSDVRILPIRPGVMQELIRANARRTDGDTAAATGLEVLWPVKLIAGGVLELLSGAAVPA